MTVNGISMKLLCLYSYSIDHNYGSVPKLIVTHFPQNNVHVESATLGAKGIMTVEKDHGG